MIKSACNPPGFFGQLAGSATRGILAGGEFARRKFQHINADWIAELSDQDDPFVLQKRHRDGTSWMVGDLPNTPASIGVLDIINNEIDDPPAVENIPMQPFQRHHASRDIVISR